MNRERVVRTAAFSLFGNLAYSVYTAALGLTVRSWWFVALAAYYSVLAVMRFSVILSHRREVKNGVSPAYVSRFTGVLFLFLSVTLAGITFLAFSGDRGVRHHEIVMISMALYTFTKLTLGVIHLLQSSRVDSPVLRTLRSISFADGLVSLFSLQRSMLVTFEGMSAGHIALFNALTGSAVYLLVFFMGINLIGGKRIIMAKSKIVKANEKIAETVVDGYKKIEKGVVDGYKKIEGGVVEGYTKMEDAFIDRFLTREGETVEEARARLKKGDEQD